MDEGFAEARVLTEVSLLPDKVRILSGRRAVAMATGIIDKIYNKKEPRKQVLVVVTSGWSVMCFDHNLKKLWEANLQVYSSFSCLDPSRGIQLMFVILSLFFYDFLLFVLPRRTFPTMLITER